MKLSIHGGLNEIGGNKILLEDSGSRVWFDFGTSFSRLSMFYDEFMNPRSHNGMTDFFEMGLLPDIKGLYRHDFLGKCSRSDCKSEFDAVFLSHAHIDHSGMIPFLNKDIPVFCSPASKLIMRVMQETGSGIGQEFEIMKEHFTGLHYTKVPHFIRQVHVVNKPIKIKDLEVEPVCVDHSIPGALGFIIKGSKTVVYTGDLRMHGHNSKLTHDFVKKAVKAKPDILITEGTRVGGDHRKMGLSEEECLAHITKYMSDTKGLVVANFPPRDLDRIKTFYSAAVACGRKLVIDPKMAVLLNLLQEDKSLDAPSPKDKHIQVYIKKKKDGNYSEKDYDKWEREFLDYKNKVTYKELEQKKSVIYLNAWAFGELIDIKPVNNSSYIYSLCEPFNDEMELDHERHLNWIKHFKLDYKQAHASGHASEEDINKMIKEINAKEVVMVHSQALNKIGN